ncbi:DUF4440 domain-containing protein [Enemella evansiae]|uniref:SgcJ/EcaC family oxidoreductase n=1 Tax=Enemella evansiae TaxID=2016499 RepID=UPI000B97BAB6|nr:SgcJ/EcaC family oxidoreductase [Enemella evansiae]OYN99067.1 DUF4440 domain-containing protein [Enemella evansiae]
MTTTPTDETLRHVLSELGRAWNAGDARAYADLFTPTASYVTFDGRLLAGREQIEQVHRFLFTGPLRGSTMVTGDDAIESVPTRTDDLAVIVSTGAVQLADRPVADDRDSIQTLVLTRVEQGWRIAAFQNTRLSAPGTPSAAASHARPSTPGPGSDSR